MTFFKQVCVVCNEPFEQFWEEEEESWHFRDARRINPSGKVTLVCTFVVNLIIYILTCSSVILSVTKMLTDLDQLSILLLML